MIDDGTTNETVGPTPVSSRRAASPIVIAAVRPHEPNPAVISAAAGIAIARGAELLVLGTMTPFVTDWVNLIPNDPTALESAQAVLFADCVELLYRCDLTWGVHVLWGQPAAAIKEIGRRRDLSYVVLGQRRSSSRLRRLRRRFACDLTRMIGAPHTIVRAPS